MRVIFILFTLLTVKVSAQNLTYSSVDSSTYLMIVNEQYDELKKIGNQALKQDIDFYYLRLRLGIVYFNEKNYEKSLLHFEMAYKMNPADEILLEYLYYANLLSNRMIEAEQIYDIMSKTLKDKIGTSDIKRNNIVFTAGNISNKNFTENGTANIKGTENIYAESTYNGNVNFVTLLLNHRFAKSYDIFYAANLFNTSSVGRVQTTFENKTMDYSNYHSQFNIGIGKQFKKVHFTLYGAFFTQKSSIYTSTFDINTLSYNYFTLENNFSNFSIGAQVKKRFKYLFPSISVNYSNFLNDKQFQTEINLVTYPKGNLNFYTISSLNNYFSKNLNKLLLRQKIGIKLSKNIWTEADCSVGNHHYFVTNQALQTYNSFDPMTFSAGINVIFVFRNFQFSPSYKFQIKESSAMKFINFQEIQTSKFKYNNNLIYTSLIWNF